MEQLHNRVYSILECRESEIVTCFKIDESTRDATGDSSDDIYEDWPIEVKVLDRSKLKPVASTDSIGFTRKFKQRVSTLNLKQFIKPAIAAAVILIVALLVFNSSVAKAVDISQIYKALERIKNVCIVTFVPEESGPSQEVWISRALNIKMFKTKTECVLWDIKGKSRKVKDLSTGPIKTAKLNEDILVKVEKTIKGAVGLLPFGDISEVPKDAEWQRIANENVQTTIANTEVYDLVWIEKKLGGDIVYRKWRSYIDIETKLPSRIEWWEKPAKEEEYELLTIIKVAYPTTVEIQAVISDAGF